MLSDKHTMIKNEVISHKSLVDMRSFYIGLFLLIVGKVSAQDDYLVTLKGDTIVGSMEIFSENFYDKVVVSNDNESEDYKAFQVKSIFKDGDFLEPVAFQNRKVFGKRLVEGSLSHYLVKSEGSYEYNVDLLAKSTDETLQVSNIGFRKRLMDFVSNCSSLYDQLEEKEIAANDLDQVLSTYNTECGKKEIKMIVKKKVTPKKNLVQLNTLLNDILQKQKNGEPIPSYMTEALESYKKNNLSDLIESFLQGVDN